MNTFHPQKHSDGRPGASSHALCSSNRSSSVLNHLNALPALPIVRDGRWYFPAP